jgi:hypothetical protein
MLAAIVSAAIVSVAIVSGWLGSSVSEPPANRVLGAHFVRPQPPFDIDNAGLNNDVWFVCHSRGKILVWLN